MAVGAAVVAASAIVALLIPNRGAIRALRTAYTRGLPAEADMA